MYNHCSIHPYFELEQSDLQTFKDLMPQFEAKTKTETDCLYYQFSVAGKENSGDKAKVHCREGYKNAEAVLQHLENVGELLGEVLKVANLTRLEIHGPQVEIDKLRGPLSDLNPEFFIVQ